MREIKFRVWDGAEMTNSDLLWLSLSGKLYEDRGSEGFVMLDNEFVVMQFTGLLDKNGVEIYEGDVLLINGYVIDVVSMEIGRTESKGMSERFFHMTIPIVSGYWVDGKEYEVIGNIHENPDLIP